LSGHQQTSQQINSSKCILPGIDKSINCKVVPSKQNAEGKDNHKAVAIKAMLAWNMLARVLQLERSGTFRNLQELQEPARTFLN
jgi:hypothetical protein